MPATPVDGSVLIGDLKPEAPAKNLRSSPSLALQAENGPRSKRRLDAIDAAATPNA